MAFDRGAYLFYRLLVYKMFVQESVRINEMREMIVLVSCKDTHILVQIKNYYPRMPIGKMQIYHLLFVCFFCNFVCLYDYRFPRRE